MDEPDRVRHDAHGVTQRGACWTQDGDVDEQDQPEHEEVIPTARLASLER
jgi:hypothetical protein